MHPFDLQQSHLVQYDKDKVDLEQVVLEDVWTLLQ